MIRQNKKLENVEYINVLWKLKSYSTKEEIYNKKYVGMPQNHINGKTKYKYKALKHRTNNTWKAPSPKVKSQRAHQTYPMTNYNLES